MTQPRVLVVEDDPSLREALCDTLEMAGYPVAAAAEGTGALQLLEQGPVGMVVTDVQMQPMDGHQLLQQVRQRHPGVPVLLMTAFGNVERAVQAMRHGAVDYLQKPFAPEVLVSKVAGCVGAAQAGEAFSVVAEDGRTREVLGLAGRVAQSEATVMLAGESGTGKEVFARYIHEASQRRDGPLVALNCAAIPDNMLEAVMFGYEKGAFTGAYQSAPGKFEQAQGGTLLLDEISEMSLELQAKLLRVLQEREVERLGARKTIQLDVRVLATTNRNLREEVAAGRFREDLFYRLNVFPLTLPPLRERPGDIPPLARHFVRQHCPSGAVVPTISAAAETLLLAHSWPGNVRELDNVIQRAMILRTEDIIAASDLRFEEQPACPPALGSVAAVDKRLRKDLRSMEEKMIIDALLERAGSRKAAAERLGISQRTLRYKLAKMREAGLEIPG